MQLRGDVGFLEYLKKRGITRLVGDAFFIFMLIVAGQLLPKLEQQLPSVAVLAPLVSDPFTILATIVLASSYVALDFMEFRLREVGLAYKLDMLGKQGLGLFRNVT
jgi:hypothetical protein